VFAYYNYSRRPGTLVVTSFPSDVQVLVDQIVVAKETPLSLERPPGTYQVVVQREGYEPNRQVIEVKAGRSVEVRADLAPIAGDVGFVLESEPPAQQALLDGQPLAGLTPLKVTRIAPGKHNVELKVPACYEPWSREVTVEAGKQPTRVRAQLRALEVQTRVQSEPPGAKIFLIESGRRTFIGETPMSAKLDPTRRYQVALERPGYKSSLQDIHFDGTCELTVDAALDRQAAVGAVSRSAVRPRPVVARPESTSEDPRAPGFLKVNTRPWTKIVIDGEDRGDTPNPRIALAPGKHKLTVVNPEFGIRYSLTVDISPGKTTDFIKNFDAEDEEESTNNE
jgi:hypothetical protein